MDRGEYAEYASLEVQWGSVKQKITLGYNIKEV
jgi:hypothetical protein